MEGEKDRPGQSDSPVKRLKPFFEGLAADQSQGKRKKRNVEPLHQNGWCRAKEVCSKSKATWKKCAGLTELASAKDMKSVLEASIIFDDDAFCLT
jgi:hypothetical protein